jgi:hypothetical protein
LWEKIKFENVHESDIELKIQKKFDMYLHHQIKRNKQSNKRWLRIMFYSLT